MLIPLLVWLIIALLLALTGTLHELPVRMPMIAASLTAVLLVLLAMVPSLRARAFARNFAVPAGWGDIIIAAWAAVLLMIRDWSSREMRSALLLWNAFGLFDILLVMALAAQQAAADSGFQNAFRSLPLSLLPTFIVPIVIATHVLLFVWLAGQRRRTA
jgi:hypothetical protein